MSTAAILAVSTAGNSAAASAASAARHQAYLTGCQAYTSSYDHARATIEQARYFAGCINALYPTPAGDLPWQLRALVAGLICSFVVDAAYGFRTRHYTYNTFPGAAHVVACGVLGVFICTVAMLLFAGLVLGIGFVFGVTP